MAHTEYKELQKKVALATQKVKPGDLYVHFKDVETPYEILFVGLTEWNEEPVVIYKTLNPQKDIVWVRRLEGEGGWLTPKIDKNGKETSRFLPYEK